VTIGNSSCPYAPCSRGTTDRPLMRPAQGAWRSVDRDSSGSRYSM
jgi:hypothetical protein